MNKHILTYILIVLNSLTHKNNQIRESHRAYTKHLMFLAKTHPKLSRHVQQIPMELSPKQ